MGKVEETYLYSVMNRGPIKLSRGIEIRSARSLYLTKEDVLECLKKAHVYRRFANGKQEQVTTANIDRLHRANCISNEDWNNVVNNNIEAATIEVEPEPVVEEIIIEPEPTVEEVVEEIIEEPETVEAIEEPESVAELETAVEIGEEQVELIDETVDDIVPEMVVKSGDEEIEDSVTVNPILDSEKANNNEENLSPYKPAESLEEADNDMGVSYESSEIPVQTNTVKYNYHKKNKHNKK